MIQRIQTIYLLLAAILMAVTAFSPILNLEGGSILFSCGIKEGESVIKPTWGIVSMAGLSALLSLVSIFMFKNRKRQSRFALFSALVILLYYVTAFVYLTSYYGSAADVFHSVAYGAALPIIAFLFLLLARASISKDEKLVKSLNRIR